MRKQSVTIKKSHKFCPAPAYHRVRAVFWLVLLGSLLPLVRHDEPVSAQPSITPVSELARLSLREGAPETVSPGTTVLWGGLEFRLAPRVKTYWRTVGDSGLPPVFSWTGSRNLQAVEVLWPVPSRFQDQSGSSIGYHDHIVLPIKMTPLDPNQPVHLKLSLDYAVCETLCMPAHFDGALMLSPRSSRNSASQILIREALAKVPVTTVLRAEAPLQVLSIAAQDKNLVLETAWPADAKDGDIFVEASEGWVFGQPVPLTVTMDAGGRRIRHDRIDIEEKPRTDSPISGLEVVVTLAAPNMAIETRATLDKQGRAP